MKQRRVEQCDQTAVFASHFSVSATPECSIRFRTASACVNARWASAGSWLAKYASLKLGTACASLVVRERGSEECNDNARYCTMTSATVTAVIWLCPASAVAPPGPVFD